MRLHHVQVSCPPGGEDEARRFYGDGLAMGEVPKPPALAGRGGVWFRAYAENGAISAELHVGVEAAFVSARKAHPAFLLADGDALDATMGRLAALGYPCDLSEEYSFTGYRRVHALDGHRNRVELLSDLRGSRPET